MSKGTQLKVVVIPLEEKRHPYEMSLPIRGNETSLKQIIAENSKYSRRIYIPHSPTKNPGYSVYRRTLEKADTDGNMELCIQILLLKCEGHKFPRNPNAHILELCCGTNFYGPLVVACNQNVAPYTIYDFTLETLSFISETNQMHSRHFPPPVSGVGMTDLDYAKQVLSTPMFYIYRFKTAWCKLSDRGVNHEWTKCLYAHRPHDFRRAPDHYRYSADDCPQGDNCEKGLRCEYSHSKLEKLYHPHKYKTTICDQSLKGNPNNCKRSETCAFYHHNSERRTQDDIAKMPKFVDPCPQMIQKKSSTVDKRSKGSMIGQSGHGGSRGQIKHANSSGHVSGAPGMSNSFAPMSSGGMSSNGRGNGINALNAGHMSATMIYDDQFGSEITAGSTLQRGSVREFKMASTSFMGNGKNDPLQGGGVFQDDYRSSNLAVGGLPPSRSLFGGIPTAKSENDLVSLYESHMKMQDKNHFVSPEYDDFIGTVYHRQNYQGYSNPRTKAGDPNGFQGGLGSTRDEELKPSNRLTGQSRGVIGSQSFVSGGGNFIGSKYNQFGKNISMVEPSSNLAGGKRDKESYISELGTMEKLYVDIDDTTDQFLSALGLSELKEKFSSFDLYFEDLQKLGKEDLLNIDLSLPQALKIMQGWKLIKEEGYSMERLSQRFKGKRDHSKEESSARPKANSPLRSQIDKAVIQECDESQGRNGDESTTTIGRVQEEGSDCGDVD
eukprot:CAMPEP_0115021492 /NCGR_PEP_ID=MMETSP0216-20121206/30925_1 /TAXON_ID=223996 /ORGANISM="Protocruzia adherens, Strain Boccale" /LENGTH=720 /DNA_ID=CAMNT_0002393871 /DNA_START=236 /DNA_END=2398 /DNA_ORIENTATION=+